ncbi:hypothetical protein BCR33DRAFT_719555 [Rhizoclosmatium globosum]|uniref:Uncharacterized protein n=1 Tax=Rhizoclosmatium globosum TaxID=329046 RepID=A0A1Y2BZE7_9FUNG|nr:hypothetical protein BCR33DRAFT_719555 [Rhizoclosmatium globosum]|eukprot:ORY40163.1 hypothetical protein BCR33DRAFT_719555 [Rhizoclosmatium globosum]
MSPPPFRLYSYYYYSFSGVSLASVVVLSVFIAKTDGEKGLSTFLSPFNIALLACGFSITSFEIALDCTIAGLDYLFDRRAIGCNLGIPTYGETFLLSVQSFAIHFLSPIISYVARLFIPTQQVKLLTVYLPLAVSILSGVVAVLIDFILMTAFVLFVRKTQYGDFQDADNKFLLISKYGIAAILQAFLALVSFAIFGVTGWLAALFSMQIFFFLTFCILGTMKWALWRNEVQERTAGLNSRKSRASRKSKSRNSWAGTRSQPKSATSSAISK